ncbi:MAG: peptide deformylase [Actinomycetota bacterium]|jgi:peptide deformylase
MAVLRIRTFGDPGLRQRAREVDKITDVHRRLVEDMLETMRAAPGVGLAAPQVGVQERIFVWEVDDEHGAVVNPVIVESSDEEAVYEEGCLSVPGLYCEVSRPARIEVRGLDLDGNLLSMSLDEFSARVWQHEIDHLDGVLFIDRLPPEGRREALATLRSQALGITPPPPAAPAEERL